MCSSCSCLTEFAWVTLTTNDNYSLGALVLAHSLKRAGTAHQLAVLVTPTVSEAMRDRLKDVYNVVQEVNVLDSQDAANLALLARPELGVTFTKLHCWRLVQFEKCVFLDADTLVSRPGIYEVIHIHILIIPSSLCYRCCRTAMNCLSATSSPLLQMSAGQTASTRASLCSNPAWTPSARSQSLQCRMAASMAAIRVC